MTTRKPVTTAWGTQRRWANSPRHYVANWSGRGDTASTEARYDLERRPRHGSRPLIVRCRSGRRVRGVEFATKPGLSLAVRGGVHSKSRFSTNDHASYSI